MREFSRNFWIYFFSGLFWSSGLMVFFLVYNLHLLEIGLNETAIGEITSASTLGSLAATLVTGKLLNHCGQIRFIQCCVLVTALLLPLRSLAHGMEFLTATAFLNGTSIAGWMVSAPPFLTHNTDPGNRAWAYSLSYGSSVGCGALAGLLVGFASHEGPAWAELREFAGFSAKQGFLLGSAASVLLGFFGLLFLRARTTSPADAADVNLAGTPTTVSLRSFLPRLLLALGLWSLFVGSFPPFFNVYFHQQFNQSLGSIGVIFAVSQLCQTLAVLCMPWLAAKLGRVRAIASAQFTSAVLLPVLLAAGDIRWASMIYLGYLSFQAMAEPALESFIMDSVRPEERSRMSSLRYLTLFSFQALAVLMSGFAITRFGYALLLPSLALLGVAASLAFYIFFQPGNSRLLAKESHVPASCPQ